MLEALGHRLATFLSRERHVHGTSPATNQEFLKLALRPADVLLVEGTSVISTAIKYLTQSTWSHAALFVGDAIQGTGDYSFVEADLVEGVRSVGLQNYAGYHCRVCRPIGLSESDVERVVAYATAQVGHAYDTRNIVDLARYLLPTPPVPSSWRRKMIAFGSGDPTRAICSGLIAQSFETIGYPVLPDVTYFNAARSDCPDCVEEVMRVRHHSLYVPRDFDVSPYFEVVKPSLIASFNYRDLKWEEKQDVQLDIGRLSDFGSGLP